MELRENIKLSNFQDFQQVRTADRTREAASDHHIVASFYKVFVQCMLKNFAC
jgi:hypothetical protein